MTTVADLAVTIEMPEPKTGDYDAEKQRRNGPAMYDTQGTIATFDQNGRPNDSRWDTDS